MALVSIEQVWPAPQCPTAGKINNIASFPRRLKSLLIKQSSDGARTASLVPFQALPPCSQALPGNKYLEAVPRFFVSSFPASLLPLPSSFFCLPSESNSQKSLNHLIT